MIKKDKAITLIALVITIIILLILAGVAIATLTGENGLITRAKQAKKTQIEAEIKESLILAVQDLQVQKVGDTTLDDITQEWIDKKLSEYNSSVKDDASISGKKITMKKDGITKKFLIDEELNITEIESDREIQFSYEVISRNGENVEVLIKVSDTENGLNKIQCPNGNIIECYGTKKEKGIDYTVQIGKEYKFKIVTLNGIEKEKIILLEDPKEIDISDEMEVALGQTETIKVTLTPSNAIAEINWTIEDNTIAELKNGTIKGLKTGNTTVTASVTLQDGSIIKDTCTINVYQKVTIINTADELRAFAQEVNKGKSFENELVKLGKDIDLGGKQEDESTWWTSIGYYNSSTDYMYFKGTFDGQNHEISGIYINNENQRGLFYNISGATIKNLGVTNSYFKSKFASSITGVLENSSKVENCYCKESKIIGNGGTAAGISMGISDGIILNCYNSSEIYFYRLSTFDNMKVGGVVGYIWNSSYNNNNIIENCYNTGKITIEKINIYGQLCVGGICGSTWNGGQLKNSYNAGNIIFSQTSTSGIIIGACDTNSITQNCYSLENVSNMNEIGLCNYVYGGGRLINCSALTDSYMKTQNFVNDLNEGNTKGNLAWKLNPNGGYPILQWQ